MNKRYPFIRLIYAALFSLMPFASIYGQQVKQQYGSLEEALGSGGNLQGNGGPESVN